MSDFAREEEMIRPLLRILISSGRLRPGASISKEFPWMGRRVDLVIMTRTLRTSAFELKLSDNFRAVEQAAGNSLAFDRSYAVTATEPSNDVLDFARVVGVGILYLRNDVLTTRLAPSCIGSAEKSLRARLISKMRAKAEALCENAYV